MTIVLQREFHFIEEDEKKNFKIPFTVNEVAEKLHVTFSFTPEAAEEEVARDKIEKGLKKYVPQEEMNIWGRIENYLPLKNLIPISIDCNNHYLGATHRTQSEYKITISKSYSSEGFIKHGIETGEWDIQLHVRCVASPMIKATLIVHTEEGGENESVSGRTS